MKKYCNQQGITLMELIIVIVLLGIIAIIAIPNFVTIGTKNDTATCKRNQLAIERAAMLSYGDAISKGEPRFPDSDALSPLFPENKLPACPVGGNYLKTYQAASGTISCTIKDHER